MAFSREPRQKTRNQWPKEIRARRRRKDFVSIELELDRLGSLNLGPWSINEDTGFMMSGDKSC